MTIYDPFASVPGGRKALVKETAERSSNTSSAKIKPRPQLAQRPGGTLAGGNNRSRSNSGKRGR